MSYYYTYVPREPPKDTHPWAPKEKKAEPAKKAELAQAPAQYVCGYYAMVSRIPLHH